MPNPHSVAVLSNAVKNDAVLESFDPANYFNNTPTKSSLSSSASYLSIQERRKTLEHGALQAKLAEDQAKRKLELLEKSFQYQKQKIENEALLAKEKVALVNFEQNLSKISVWKSSPSRLNYGDVYTQNNRAPMYKVENAEHFNELNPITNASFSANSVKFHLSDYYKQLRKRELADKFIDDIIECQETSI